MQSLSPTEVKAIEFDSKQVEARLQANGRVGIETQSWVNKPTFGADEDGEAVRAQRQGGREAGRRSSGAWKVCAVPDEGTPLLLPDVR